MTNLLSDREVEDILRALPYNRSDQQKEVKRKIRMVRSLILLAFLLLVLVMVTVWWQNRPVPAYHFPAWSPTERRILDRVMKRGVTVVRSEREVRVKGWKRVRKLEVL